MKIQYLSLGLLQFLTPSLLSQQMQDPNFSLNLSSYQEENIERGFRFTYQERYEDARKEFEKLIRGDPESPAGYFYLAGLLGLYMNDFSTLSTEEEFLFNIEKAVEKAEKWIMKSHTSFSPHPSLAWAYFYMGGSYGYRAYHHYQKRAYLRSFNDTLKAFESFKKSLELDSTLYDAYMGMGGYHYFMSEIWGVFPFVGKEPEEGIREVRLAMEKGRYSRIAAKNGLILLLLREKQYPSALQLSLELIGEYPNNRTFNWILAKVFQEMGDWERALMTYERLFQLIREGQPENLNNLLSCQLEISQIFYQQKRYEECIINCQMIIEHSERNPSSRDFDMRFPAQRDFEKEAKRLLKKARIKKGGK